MSQPNQPLTPTPSTAQPSTQPAVPTAANSAPAITGVAKGGGKIPKVQIQVAYQALVSGLQSTYEPSDTFVIAGQTLTRDEIIARLNAFIALGEATKATRQQWQGAVEAERAGLVAVNSLRQNLRSIVQARLGSKGASGLTAFGFSPAKTAKRTVTNKATAVAKTTATRAARHTMGKVQKQDITGDVVGITVTPLVASAPVPASMQPSTPATPTGTTPTGSASPAPATPSNHAS
jgi:hypothetical protein